MRRRARRPGRRFFSLPLKTVSGPGSCSSFSGGGHGAVGRGLVVEANVSADRHGEHDEDRDTRGDGERVGVDPLALLGGGRALVVADVVEHGILRDRATGYSAVASVRGLCVVPSRLDSAITTHAPARLTTMARSPPAVPTRSVGGPSGQAMA